jgi:hypothetical protein
MTTQIIDGTAAARQVREDVAKGVAALAAAGGPVPGLATVLIGDDPPSADVHHGQAAAVQAQRASVPDAAYDAHPNASSPAPRSSCVPASAPEPNHSTPGMGRRGYSASKCALACTNVGGAAMPSKPAACAASSLRYYQDGRLKLDELITARYTLDWINQGYDDMRAGVNFRGIIEFRSGKAYLTSRDSTR